MNLVELKTWVQGVKASSFDGSKRQRIDSYRTMLLARIDLVEKATDSMEKNMADIQEFVGRMAKEGAVYKNEPEKKEPEFVRIGGDKYISDTTANSLAGEPVKKSPLIP